jgi:hypothetical protein
MAARSRTGAGNLSVLRGSFSRSNALLTAKALPDVFGQRPRGGTDLFGGIVSPEFYLHHLSSVNTCVYEPSAFRVLANWPRAPMYLPVPPNIART